MALQEIEPRSLASALPTKGLGGLVGERGLQLRYRSTVPSRTPAQIHPPSVMFCCPGKLYLQPAARNGAHGPEGCCCLRTGQVLNGSQSLSLVLAQRGEQGWGLLLEGCVDETWFGAAQEQRAPAAGVADLAPLPTAPRVEGQSWDSVWLIHHGKSWSLGFRGVAVTGFNRRGV